MRPLIMRNGTICYSILYCNSPGLYIRLKQMYSVISVKLDWLPGNTKKWTIEQFVAFGVRFFHSWADPHTQLMNSKKGIEIETKEREQKGGGKGKKHKTQNKTKHKIVIIVQIITIPTSTTNIHIHYFKQYSCVQGLLRECRSIRSRVCGPPYYCAALVCVSAVIDPVIRLGLRNQRKKESD